MDEFSTRHGYGTECGFAFCFRILTVLHGCMMLYAQGKKGKEVNEDPAVPFHFTFGQG